MFICISAAETVLRNHLTGTISKTRFSRKIVTKINIPFKKQNIVGTKMHITPQSLLKKQKKSRRLDSGIPSKWHLSEIIPCRKVDSVCIVCLVIKINAPTVQILNTQLHIICYIIKEVRCKILALSISSRVSLGKALA